jgi:hypothetical protein
MVDGRNCPVTEPDLRKRYEVAIRAYSGRSDKLILAQNPTGQLGEWIAEAMK